MYIAFPLVMVILLIAAAYIYSLKKQNKAQAIQNYYYKRRLYSAIHNIAWAYYEQYSTSKKNNRDAIARRAADTVLFVLYPQEGQDRWIADITELSEVFPDFTTKMRTNVQRQEDKDQLYKLELVRNDLAEFLSVEWDIESSKSEDDK